MNTERFTIFLTISLVLGISAALLSIKMAAPYDGYQGFSEAWYAQIAENYDSNSWLEPTIDGETDLRVPPFYSYMLYFSYLAFGRAEWAMRLISILFGLTSVLLVFLIGRNLYGYKAGLAASALMAVSPVFILTSHNVQTDSMFLMCVLAGLYFILCFRINDNPGTLVFGAVMYGCGLFTKQFAAIAIAAFIFAEIYNRKYGPRYCDFKPSRIFITALIILVIPGHFYLYHVVKHPALLFLHSRYGAVTAAGVPGISELGGIAAEMFFGIGPAAVVLCCAGLAQYAIKRRTPEPHVLFPLVLYVVFFLFLHKHTYYMFAIVPFACLIAGQFISEVKWKSIGVIVVSCAVAAGIIHSTMVMGALKYGYDRFLPLCEYLDSMPGRKIVVVDHNVMSQFGPAVQYYCGDNEVIDRNVWLSKSAPGFVKTENGAIYFFLDYTGVNTAPAPFRTYQKKFSRSIYGPSVFGRVFYYVPFSSGSRMRAFIPGEIAVAETGNTAPFGIAEVRTYDSVVLTQLPPGFGIFMNTAESVAAGSQQFHFVNLNTVLPADVDKVNKQR